MHFKKQTRLPGRNILFLNRFSSCPLHTCVCDTPHECQRKPYVGTYPNLASPGPHVHSVEPLGFSHAEKDEVRSVFYKLLTC